DQKAGVAQIPVNEAMKIILEKGLPAVHPVAEEKKYAMRVLGAMAGVAALLLAASCSSAQMIPDNVRQSAKGLPPALVNVHFDPELNAQIPLDTEFTDEMGKPVLLREYAGKKPLVLVFAYYTCPMLCSQVEQAVVGTLKMISFNPGKDYDV